MTWSAGIQPPSPRTGSQTQSLDPHGMGRLLLPRRGAIPPHARPIAGYLPARPRPPSSAGKGGIFGVFCLFLTRFSLGERARRRQSGASSRRARAKPPGRHGNPAAGRGEEATPLPPLLPGELPPLAGGGAAAATSPLPAGRQLRGRLPPLRAGAGAAATASLPPSFPPAGAGRGSARRARELPADERDPAEAADEPGEGAGGVRPAPGAILPPPAAAAAPLRCAGQRLVPATGGRTGGAGGSPAPPPGVRPPAAVAARGTEAPAGGDEELGGFLQPCHPACSPRPAAAPVALCSCGCDASAVLAAPLRRLTGTPGKSPRGGSSPFAFPSWASGTGPAAPLP